MALSPADASCFPAALPVAAEPAIGDGLATIVELRLLGVVPAEGAADLARALGPDVRVEMLGAVAAMLQPNDPALAAADAIARRAAMAALEQRLSRACQAGPFLACAPDAACCARAELLALLDGARHALAAALARHGRQQQWDVVLGATETATVPCTESRSAAGREERARRIAALRHVLAPCVHAIAAPSPSDAEAECRATILAPPGARSAIESALATLPEDAAGDAQWRLLGPLPALAFHPLRIARGDAQDPATAWAVLRLPERLDPAELARRWQDTAHGRAEPGAGLLPPADGHSALPPAAA